MEFNCELGSLPFEVKEVQHLVKEHLNHPKSEVRSEMQLYLVNLFHFKGLDFLNEIKPNIRMGSNSTTGSATVI
jgi:hypothetical protein